MKILRPYQQEAIDSVKHLVYRKDDPLLINASVGAGKSLIIAELLGHCQRLGRKALCLTLSCELIEQNALTFKNQYFINFSSIFCAALASKNLSGRIVFASPQSLVKSLGNESFDLIIIDEAHTVNMASESGMYRRIINHYQHNARLSNQFVNVLGLTGTPFRGRESIVGQGSEYFFKRTAYTITAKELINQNYLVEPKFLNHRDETNIDYSSLKIDSMGRFDAKQLHFITDSNLTKTQRIMHSVGHFLEYRNPGGIFIFCATMSQCKVCFEVLTQYGEARIVSALTPSKERMESISLARQGVVRFLININCLCIGVDIPNFDTIVFVRPTESLTLFIQALGRGLRLSPGKSHCTILDYAGNLESHQDIDDPILNEVHRKKEEEKDYCIPCYQCGALNAVTARRCIGEMNTSRCDYYFDFKECPKCTTKNDITSRQCRECDYELIDYNKKLTLQSQDTIFGVLKVKYHASMSSFTALYYCKDGLIIPEGYSTNSELSLRIFYNKFIKEACVTPSKHYKNLRNQYYLLKMIELDLFKQPKKLICRLKEDGWHLKKRIYEQLSNES